MMPRQPASSPSIVTPLDVASPSWFGKRYATPRGNGVMGRAKRPTVALIALFGFLGSQ